MSVGVTIADFVEGCRNREGRLPFEIGAFVALEICEALLTQGPAVASPKDTRISAEGNVAVYAPPHSASGEEAARSVVDILAHLLVASGTGVPPVLLSLVERGPSNGVWDLSKLRDELEASLVPLNRSAARRVLSRLLKETKNRRAAAPVPSADSVDADLDALLDGYDSDNAPTMRLGALDDEALAKVVASTRSATVRPPKARPITPPRAAPPSAAPRPPAEPQRPAREPRRSEPEPTDVLPQYQGGLDEFEDPAGSNRGGILAVLAMLALIAAGVAALVLLRPDVVARILGNAPPEEPEVPAEVEPAPTRPHGNLIVSAPAEAQILFFVGRGPAVAEDLPRGVAHEFVAVADGRSPTRAVVPSDAVWQGGDSPRYELAMQTGDSDVAFEQIDLGETGLTREGMGTPSGGLGSIRVITTPPGARVFLLIGFGSARIEDLPADEPVELLVYSAGQAPRRIFIGPSDWTEGADGLEASVDVTFE
ncbi:MAG: hypothetical protein AB8H86_00340 [Polyangiales bacterium]